MKTNFNFLKLLKMKQIFIIIILLSLIFSSCKKNFTELNVNPNEVTNVDPALLFKQSLKDGAGSYNTDVNAEQWGLMNWVMFMGAKGGIIQGEEYTIPGSKDALWNEQYSNALMNVQEVINLHSDSTEYVNQISVARIWKVFLFQRITDLWGQIPYSDALKGYSDLNYMPKYDTQKNIYYNMLSELKEASENIDPNSSFFDADVDLIFNGDIVKWQKFANSLRLRLAIRIKFIDNEKYTEELAEIQNLILISQNQESALFPFNSEKKNHLYEAFYTNQADVQNNPSKFLVDLLVNTNDPRIKIFLQKTPLSEAMPWIPEYQGVPNLLLNTASEWDAFDANWGDISKIGTWFLRDETPGVFMSYAEVCFLKAEAALDGFFQGNAQNLYKEGITANMEFYSLYGEDEHQISETEISVYLNSISSVDLENIITQKWLTFVFENGYEAYSEYRRTGFPILKYYDETEIDNTIFPKRFPYPSTEINLNGENYTNAVNEQGEDNEFTKVWWNTNE